MTLIIVVLVLAALLFSLELILPGGILGIFGGVMLLLGVWLTLQSYGAFWAVIVLVAGLVFSAGFFFVQLKVLPKTKLGKSMFLETRQSATSGSTTDDSLLGQTGEVVAQLTPGGTVKINERSYDAISKDGLLEPGEPVEVVGRDAFRLIVRKKA